MDLFFDDIFDNFCVGGGLAKRTSYTTRYIILCQKDPHKRQQLHALTYTDEHQGYLRKQAVSYRRLLAINVQGQSFIAVFYAAPLLP